MEVPLPDRPNIHYPLLWATETVKAVADTRCGCPCRCVDDMAQAHALLPSVHNVILESGSLAAAVRGKLDPLNRWSRSGRLMWPSTLLPDDVPLLRTDDNLCTSFLGGITEVASVP